MKILIIDTETTGFFKGSKVPLYAQPEIFELAGQIIDSTTMEQDREAPEGGFLVLKFRPKARIPQKIEELVHIKDADYDGKPSFLQEYPRIRQFFAYAQVLVAHNLDFDLKMMALELMRIKATDMFPFPSTGVCTMKDARVRWPGQPNRLIDLHYRVCGTSVKQEHNAVADVEMLFEIIKAKPEIVLDNVA